MSFLTNVCEKHVSLWYFHPFLHAVTLSHDLHLESIIIELVLHVHDWYPNIPRMKQKNQSVSHNVMLGIKWVVHRKLLQEWSAWYRHGYIIDNLANKIITVLKLAPHIMWCVGEFQTSTCIKKYNIIVQNISESWGAVRHCCREDECSYIDYLL